jgi:hypothetical protein
MDEREKKIRRKLRDDFVHYASRCLKIRTKFDGIKPFILNKSQMYIHELVEKQKRETGKVRVIIVKGRQQGCSTYIEGRFYWLVTHHFGLRAFILTHDATATNNLFEMAQRYHEYCPNIVRPSVEASNAKELVFAGLDSGYKLGTAGNKAVGRSSTIQLLHGSEVAYWPNASEHSKGILQAVPGGTGTEIFIESTANGQGNYFHEQWQLAEKGLSDFIPIFIPWFWDNDYVKEVPKDFIPTDEEEELIAYYNLSPSQIMWRRHKIMDFSSRGVDGTKSFYQEYPCNSTEAFQLSGEDSFILPETVMLARNTKIEEEYGNLVIGVDPARFGDDRTSIIRRRGRKAYGLQSYVKKETMEVVGIINSIIVKENPVRVFIDIANMGAGIYDRLVEIGHKNIVVAVNFGSVALDQERYINKRTEMWGLMKEWLLSPPCEIPDSDTLHADLCGVKYKPDSISRLELEPKERMKKRGLRSPDEADALALTFALPEIALTNTRKKEYKETAQSMADSFRNLDRLKKSAYIK